MTYRFLDPGIRVALDRISDLCRRPAGQFTTSTAKGKLPLEAAVSRIT